MEKEEAELRTVKEQEQRNLNLFKEGISDGSDESNDLLLAQMLQLEFDKEYDDFVKSKEKVFNQNSNVKVSFEKYCAVHPYDKEHSSDSSQDDDYDADDYDSDYDDSQSPSDGRIVTKKRPIGPGSDVVTKHDAIVCGRRNTKHVENFPPEFATGDVASKYLDVKLPNHVYNTLKLHSMKEEKHSHKITEKKEHSTHEQALDPKTRIMLYKLVNSQVLENINGCISTGKEAVVFHAKGGIHNGEVFPPECAVKVYKTTLIEFKTREKYIKDDFRFRDRFTKQNPRKIIPLWAEKEMRNLKRMYEHGINCPHVLLLRKHILVMAFIGNYQKPAPKLKDAKLSMADLIIAYEQCIEMMQKMYKECNLIHADLSEYNMLWHDDRLWFIDVSQSIEPKHPRALEFLARDCENVVNFFKKSGVTNVLSVEELFNHVSGLEISGQKEDLLNQIRDFEQNEELLTHGMTENMNYFDYFFKLSKNENEHSAEEGDEDETTSD